jgi:thiol-disulfide isomerase/thioredoxin
LSKVINVDSLDSLLETLETTDNVVVVFSARDWCVPCQRLAPHVEAASQQLEDVTFLDVDVDHVEGVKEKFGIMSVPQVWHYRDGLDVTGVPVKARTALQLISEIRRD